MPRREHENIPDAELFRNLAAGGKVAEKAFAELYARHGGRVYAFCLRFLGNRDEAQDVYQDTFLRFYESASEDREMTNVPGFLLKIARNLCLNARRNSKKTVTVDDYHVALKAPEAEKTEFLELITAAMDMLPDEYREVFLLREYQGMSYAEIAEVVDTSLANVKVRIFRAKQRIRQILSPYIREMSES